VIRSAADEMGNTAIEPGERVVVEDPEHTNLLGLLMKDLVASNLADDATYEKMKAIQGDIQVRAGDMVVTMRFGGDQLRILDGEQKDPKASVGGSMPALLSVVTGGGMIGPLLSGAIKIGGNPFVLLKVLPLIRSPQGGTE
jgi:hypothetical protein